MTPCKCLMNGFTGQQLLAGAPMDLMLYWIIYESLRQVIRQRYDLYFESVVGIEEENYWIEVVTWRSPFPLTNKLREVKWQEVRWLAVGAMWFLDSQSHCTFQIEFWVTPFGYFYIANSKMYRNVDIWVSASVDSTHAPTLGRQFVKH